MTTRSISIAAFVIGAIALAAIQIGNYDSVHKSPKHLSPPLLFFDCVMLFVGVNLIAFAINIFKSAASVRGSKDEQLIEEVMNPAFQGNITDERILRYTAIPFFVTLGAVIAAALVWIFR